MSINLNFGTHSNALFSTYQAVLTGDKKITWVVYGYDKGANDLKVMETGGGDLEELQEEFDDGKIQYAFVRVIDPNTELSKLVLIGWCGEGVPESKKGLFNSHFNDVAKFLKGYHIQITARSEADVDPACIMKRINEGGGSKYSINIDKHLSKKEEPILPVHSVYQPEKIPDITALQRKAPRDEIKPVSSVYQPVQLPKPKPLATRTTWRTTTEEEKTPSMAELRAQKLRENREKEEHENREKEERENREKEERENREKEEHENREKEERENREKEEHENRVQQERERLEYEERELREHQERERSAREEEEQRRQQEKINLRLAKEKEDIENEENERKERLRIQKEQELKEKQEQRKKAEEIFRREEQEISQAAKSETVADIVASVDKEDSISLFRAQVLFSYDADDSNEMTLFEGEIIKDILRVDEGWWQGVSEDETRSGLFPANYVGVIEDEPEPVQDFIQKPDAEQQDAIDENEQNAQSAIAQYDYEARESNEISFVEGDLITNIEFVSEDWWQGTASDRTVGLFPANHVKLQE